MQAFGFGASAVEDANKTFTVFGAGQGRQKNIFAPPTILARDLSAVCRMLRLEARSPRIARCSTS
jgi:hypothetical protein